MTNLEPNVDDLEKLPVEVPATPEPDEKEQPGKVQPANGGWSSQDQPLAVN